VGVVKRYFFVCFKVDQREDCDLTKVIEVAVQLMITQTANECNLITSSLKKK
jgi:hypothetical protein